MNDLLERLAKRGSPAGAAEMIARVERQLGGESPAAEPRRPWLAAVAAAAVVVAAVGGAAWLLGRGGGESAALPAGPAAWPEFAMDFEWAAPGEEHAFEPGDGQEGSGSVGRLLWRSPDEWRIEQAPLQGESFATTAVAFLQDGELHTLGRGGSEPLQRPDGDEPLPWLAEQVPPALAWERARPAAGLEPLAATPTHPLAAIAAAADGMRMEFTAEGIPVLLEVAGSPTFRALELVRRPVGAEEIAASVEGHEIRVEDGSPVPSGDLVRLVEGDGYQVALIARGDCLNAYVFTPAGDHGSGGGCGLELAVADALTAAGATQLPDGRFLTFFHGYAEPVARVEVEFPDGTVLADEARGGYWLLATVAVPEGPFQVRGYDEAGALLAAVEVPLSAP